MQLTTTTILSAHRAENDSEADAFRPRVHHAPSERLFVALCDAYAPFGGVAWSEDLARVMRAWRPALRKPSLARLIESEEIFHFRWRDAAWIPMVQFHSADLSINEPIRLARQELGWARDGWEAASWFVSADVWLGGRRPVDVIDRELSAVLEAARFDRFVATG